MNIDTELAAIASAELSLLHDLLGHLSWFSTGTLHGAPVLTRNDGVSVSARIGGYGNEGRVRFSIRWPLAHPGTPGSAEVYPSEYDKKDAGNPTTTITVAVTTAPAKMAKQITTRLLTPGTVALWKAMEKRAADARVYEDKTEATLAVLAVATNGRARGTMLYPSVDGIYTIQVSGDKCRMDLNSVTLDQALAVIALLKGGAK